MAATSCFWKRSVVGKHHPHIFLNWVSDSIVDTNHSIAFICHSIYFNLGTPYSITMFFSSKFWVGVNTFNIDCVFFLYLLSPLNELLYKKLANVFFMRNTTTLDLDISLFRSIFPVILDNLILILQQIVWVLCQQHSILHIKTYAEYS